MSNSGNSIKFEAIREIADVSTLTTSYVVFGGVFTRDAFRITISNASNVDIYLSTDGTTNNMKLAAFTGRVLDNKTNDMYLRDGTQFYIKAGSAPASPAGWATLEVEYV